HVAFSPDDKLLAWTYGAEPIILRNVSSGEMVRQFKGHQGSVFGISFTPDGRTLIAAGQSTPDGRTLVAAGEDAVRLWDVATGKEMKAFGEKCNHACLTRDGKVLASIHAGGLVRLWDVTKGKPIRQWQTHTDQIRTLAFSPDGRLLASGGGWNSTVH